MSPVELHCAAMAEKQTEINELKAMVNGLRDALGEIQCLPSVREDEGSSIAFRARKKIGAQWMANAYANEIERALDASLTQVRQSSSLQHADTLRLYFIKEHANKLRKTMITTSSESSLSEVVNKINEEL